MVICNFECTYCPKALILFIVSIFLNFIPSTNKLILVGNRAFIIINLVKSVKGRPIVILASLSDYCIFCHVREYAWRGIKVVIKDLQPYGRDNFVFVTIGPKAVFPSI